MRSRWFWLLPLTPLALVLVAVAPAHLSPATAAPPPAPEFSREGVAFVQKYCVHCHNDKTHKADLTLHGYKDDASVLKELKVWQNVLRMVKAGEMPPSGRSPRPSAAEVEAFAQVVNGVYEKAARSGKVDPGQVTVRRLNRTEYNNTIRDLVGVDFQPAEDFPSDDIGHGFDNIGDVLSLSPVLMERYLAAAESIVQRAIVPHPPKPPVRHVASRWLEPATSEAFRWRPINPGVGMLHSQFSLTMDGEYTFRVRIQARSATSESPRVAILVDGKEVKTFPVKGTEQKPETLEMKLAMEKGPRRVAVKHLNPPLPGNNKTEKKDRNEKMDRGGTVLVESFVLEGPADTRPATHRRLLACNPSASKKEQTREVLERFATRAYRRPATPAEVARLVKLVESAEAQGEKWESGIQLAMQAVLVSPKFLFRIELDQRPDSPAPHPLDEYQLASRLSYFLWSSMPDDELFALAARKELTRNLDAQVQRMLKDPRSQALVNNFAMQWLQLQRLKTFAPDAKLFPTFNEQLRSAMMKETALFFEAVLREDRSILDLIDSDFTFLNEPLARHYGIADTNGNLIGQKPTQPRGEPIRGEQFRRVTLQNRDRGGLLTQASVLTVTSNPTRTSPVKRGRWVLEQLLGTPPPPPPPNVPELVENEKAVLSGSLRQRMEQHRANPACANCHAKMDPLGFAFENYNAIGGFRSKDGDFPIDPSGTLPDGKTVKGPGDLKGILKEKKELFSRCLAEKMLIYALGRGLEYYDRPTIERIQTALAANNYKFSTLVSAIVQSDPFRLRRGKDQAK